MEPSPKYCDQCGKSVVALDVPHTARQCVDCDRTIYVVEPGDDGGIKVQAGDKFVIPADFLQFSLDPTQTTGKFFRPGISWFVRNLYFHHVDEIQRIAAGEVTPEKINGILDGYENEADAVLKNSKMFEYLDLDDEEQAAKAVKHVQEERDSREWWAMLVGALAKVARDAICAGDVARAVSATNAMVNARAMLIFAQHLESHVWQGYRANQAIFECAAAAASTPGESEAIKKLQPLFEELDEPTLEVWTNDGQPIGPRIGVSQVREETLLALAQWYRRQFDVNREQQGAAREERRKDLDIRLKVLGAGIAIGGLFTGIVTIILKVSGVL